MSPSAPAVDIAGCGDPVVLLHGLATTRAIWVGAAPRLARTRRVVTLDIPGFGIAPPAGRGFELAGVADRVHAEVRAAGLGGPVDLVGHSMGAAVALALAARHPAPSAASSSSRPPGCARCRSRSRPASASPRSSTSPSAGAPRRSRRSDGGGGCSWPGGVVDGAALHPAVVRELVGASLGARRIGPALTAVARADLRATLARAGDAGRRALGPRRSRDPAGRRCRPCSRSARMPSARSSTAPGTSR